MCIKTKKKNIFILCNKSKTWERDKEQEKYVANGKATAQL